MGLRERVRAGIDGFLGRTGGAVGPATGGTDLIDLPLQTDLVARRESATTTSLATRAAQKAEGISLGMGLSLDQDDYQYRRLTSGAKFQRRDLSPLQQDRMLEIAWYLWEQNPFARRLVTLMTDLILGEGWTVEADDERIAAELEATWNHRVNQLSTRVREFHNALALNGELILPVGVNPFTGRPTIGFLDPYQVKDVLPDPQNVLIPDVLILKSERGLPERQLKIVREDPATGRMTGEVIYHAINKLPNSLRGRSDLMPLADWLDLYDQYLFAEVERLHLLSSFVWDYKIEGATDQKQIDEKLKKFPTPKPGSVFAHNEKETLEAVTPDLKTADRSEAGKMLRVHIAGSYGFPLSHLGETDSNRATIEGQNDVLLKTPAARQKEFMAFLDQVVRFTIDSTTGKNPVLFEKAVTSYHIRMPEIAAKDINRVGTVLASVVSAMDTGMSNRTISRKLATTVQLALVKHLGVDADVQEVLEEADLDAEERQAVADTLQADMALQRAGGGGNPPVPEDEDEDDEDVA